MRRASLPSPVLLVAASLVSGVLVSGALGADTRDTASPGAASGETDSAAPVSPAASDAPITSDAPAALDLAAHAGKVVYVDFWASWCTPCRASFPWMNALQAELGEDGFVVLGVNTGDDPEAAARFLDEVPTDFEIVHDTDGAIARAYGVQGMPMAYVHDRNGELVASHTGFNDELAESREAKIRALVADGR